MSDKQIFENRWVSVYETEDGYVYSHETRCGGHIVSIMPIRRHDDGRVEVLGRFEVTPAHGPNPIKELVSITGGVDDKDPIKTAIKELREEAGIVAEEGELLSLGTLRPSKSADTVVHLYVIELAMDAALLPAEGDGSHGEEGAYCQWVNMGEVADSKDPLLHAAMLRFMKEFKFELHFVE